MKTTSIKQSAEFSAPPEDVYALLMDSKQHAAFSGGGARISSKVGGSFTTFDGWASGQNKQLIPNKKIVQTWRNDDWPEGHFSTITFDLKPTKTGTKLTFTQKDVPSQFAKDIAKGWREYYWKPIKDQLSASS